MKQPVYGCTSHLWNRAFLRFAGWFSAWREPFYPVSVIGILPLPESGGKDKKMTDMMNCVDKLREKKISGYKQRMAVNPYGVYR